MTRRRRKARRFPELRRTIILLAVICFIFRLLCRFGAEDSVDRGMTALAHDHAALTLMLKAGLGSPRTVPDAAEPDDVPADAPPTSPDAVPAEETPPAEQESSVPEPEPEAPAEAAPADPAQFYSEEYVTLKNYTDCSIDINALLADPLPFAEGAAVLILHTHGSEAYTPAGDDIYAESDPGRTEDTAYSVIRVGDELAGIFEAAGITVFHDRNIYDYPSYTGSYGRSLEAAQTAIAEHPEIGIVIDLHRDSMLAEDGSQLGTVYEGPDGESSQVMLVMCTGSDGLDHPNWRQNMSFALKLQSVMNGLYPGLARPLSVRGERFNQHVSGGAMLIEVGMYGNTLSQALNAVRLFGECATPVITGAE